MASTTAVEPTHRRARGHSFHIYLWLILASLIILEWGLARVAVCWGRYFWLGAIACHSQWATFLGLVIGTAVAALLIRDLSEPHLSAVQARRFRRTRAAWRGYQRLERPASKHVAAATILILLAWLGFVLLIFVFPIHF